MTKLEIVKAWEQKAGPDDTYIFYCRSDLMSEALFILNKAEYKQAKRELDNEVYRILLEA